MRSPSSKTALDRLKIIQRQLGPDTAYFIEPNMVLSLADARGFGDQLTYYDREETREKIQTALEKARAIEEDLDCRIFIESKSNRVGESWIGYELLNPSGFEWSLAKSKIVAISPPKKFNSKAEYENWYVDLRKAVSEAHPEWVDNEAILNDVCYGLILGYPDAAIFSILEDNEENHSEYIDANIKYADFHLCPQPVYSYHKSLKNTPEISEHENLWSNILTEVYESDWYRDLAADSLFKSIRARIEKY